MSKEKIQWQPMVEMIIVLVTILGSTIPLYLQTDSKILHADSKMEEHRRESNRILEAIRQDMKDFHGRLCAIEENRGKNRSE